MVQTAEVYIDLLMIAKYWKELQTMLPTSQNGLNIPLQASMEKWMVNKYDYI